MNDIDTNNDSPNDVNNDRTVPANSVPHVSSGMYHQGDPLLQSGMMLPPQAPGILGMIGKYSIIRVLGEGGMGQVLLAREPVTDSLVAIKMIKPEFLNKSWAVHRFLTEARHMYKMAHPSIIRVLDVSDRAEGPYFVMPFMAGGSLADKIKPGEALPTETILPVARAVAEALHHAHTHGITHRDLKPSNILLDSDAMAHLADFGLLRTFFNDSIVDASQPQLEGTVPYMSPAVAAGKAEDTRCDIYAFGCLLYEMLTGQPPYQGPSVDAVLKQIQDGPPPPVRQLNPHAPAALVAICDHAMARELRDRYASMADVVAELERVAQGKAVIGTHGREKGSGGKKKPMIAAGVVALVGLAAFGISQLSFWKSDKTKPDTGIATPGTGTEPSVVERKPGAEMLIALPNGVTMKLVWIPATSSEAWKKISDGKDYFVMGSPPDEPGRQANEDQVNVKLSQGFWMAQTECTQKQWMAVMGGNPSEFKGDDLPVERVSWIDAQEFISKLNEAKILPAGWKAALSTEAQWEYACRAGTKTTYSFGNTINVEQANSGNSNDGKTCSVASYPANAWGLHDMHGNVCEWCADWMGEKLPGGTDPTGATSGAARLLRGGGCPSAPYECRAAQRDACDSGGSTRVWGFRVAVNPPPSTVLVAGPFSYTVSDGTITIVTVTIVKYTGSGGDLVIPDKLNELPVTAIGAGAFKDCTKLNGLTIPTTVTGIAKEAFSGCASLASVHFKGNAPVGGADPSLFSGSDQANIYYLQGTTGWATTFGGRPTLLQVQDYNCMIDNGAVTIAKYTGAGGDVVIPDKINELPVTRIGDNAFLNSTSLTSLTIPNSVTSVGNWSFVGCSKLTRVTIPASVTSLDGCAFTGCGQLNEIMIDHANPAYSVAEDGVVFNKEKTRIVHYPRGKSGNYAIPESVTQIGGDAFNGSAQLTAVTIPNSVTAFGISAFYGCSGLTRIEIPNIVSEMGENILYGCTSLTDITIPDSVADIGPRAFDGCGKLATVVVGKNIAKINGAAFVGCGNLINIYFKGNAPSLGDDVFAGADKATIYYQSGTTGWGKEFGGRPTAVWDEKCPFTYTTENGTVTITKYFGPGGEVVIPDKINDLPVTCIGAGTFKDCTKLNGLTIPATVTGIAKEAFSGCTSLGSVKFKGNAPVGGTDPSVFSGSDQTSVYYLSGTTGWATTFAGRPTFLQVQDYNCSIENGAVTIAKYTGTGGDVVIPDKINDLPVTSVGGDAFNGDTHLTAVTIPNSVTSIGGWSFVGCSKLTKVTIPASVTKWEGSAFADCGQLNSIALNEANPAFRIGGDGVVFNKEETILVYYPSGKAGTYNVPASVTQIADAAFQGSAELTEVTIPNGVTAIGSCAFKGCIRLTRIEISNRVSQMGDQVFMGCTSLTNISVPDSVTSIDGWMFINCTGLTTVVVGKGVAKINGGAFAGCGNLTNIYFNGNAPGLDSEVFAGTDKATIYHLPNTTGWGKEFGGRPTAVWDKNAKAKN